MIMHSNSRLMTGTDIQILKQLPHTLDATDTWIKWISFYPILSPETSYTIQNNFHCSYFQCLLVVGLYQIKFWIQTFLYTFKHFYNLWGFECFGLRAKPMQSLYLWIEVGDGMHHQSSILFAYSDNITLNITLLHLLVGYKYCLAAATHYDARVCLLFLLVDKGARVRGSL